MQRTEAAHVSSKTPETLASVKTPCLVLDECRMTRNIERLHARLDAMGAPLRPHLKSSKSVEIARRVMRSPTGPATVSTIEEASRFADAGVRDLIYAVGITSSKLERIVELLRRQVDVAVLLDTIEQAISVAKASREARIRIPTLIEIDCDGYRSGLLPTDGERLVAIGRILDRDAELRGVLTHAGGSYAAPDAAGLSICAETERRSVVEAASVLRGAGLPCPVVSMGSTPTAHSAIDLDGITEVRAGVFVFFDLEQANLGICRVDEIALSVLTTVIGHRREKGWIIVDAGWMALSANQQTTRLGMDRGFGLVCDRHLKVFPDLVVSAASQEHGIVAVRGPGGVLPETAVGDRLRILPIHACATAAQHEEYQVVRGRSEVVHAVWPRFGGW